MNTPTNRDMERLAENGPAIAPPVLKDCPFCGDKAMRHSSRGLAFYVWCEGCACSTDAERCDADAIDAWNKRAKPADCGVIEAMLAYPSVNEFVRTKEAEVELLWKHIAQITNQTDPAWAITLAKQFIKERES